MLYDIKTIIAKTVDTKNMEVKPETRFVEDLGADYLDLAEMEMALEDKYEIDILTDRTVMYSKTVADLIKAVEKRIRNKKA